jgi:NADPH:quinone reductase-like Zn-dependent oxidoreductase
MKAIVCTAYGPPEVLRFQEVDKPVPESNEVLIRVHATTVHREDSRMRGLDIPGPGWQRLMARLVLGIKRPKNAALGMDLAGKIEAVGSSVTRFKEGDEVFGSTMWSGFGAYAEYKCMAEDGLLDLKPANMTFEEAAVIPSGGITTLFLANVIYITYPGRNYYYNGNSYKYLVAALLAEVCPAQFQTHPGRSMCNCDCDCTYKKHIKDRSIPRNEFIEEAPEALP